MQTNLQPYTHMSRSGSSNSATGSPAPSSASGLSSTEGTCNLKTAGKSKTVKPPNVFSNDGSFLDRIRRSMKEEEDKKKEKEALERKKHFADRFKARGKRPPPSAGQSSASDTNTPDTEGSPKKKQKLDDDRQDDKEDGSAQAQYHKAMESYSGSLKDGGNGVRPLIK